MVRHHLFVLLGLLPVAQSRALFGVRPVHVHGVHARGQHVAHNYEMNMKMKMKIGHHYHYPAIMCRGGYSDYYDDDDDYDEEYDPIMPMQKPQRPSPPPPSRRRPPPPQHQRQRRPPPSQSRRPPPRSSARPQHQLQRRPGGSRGRRPATPPSRPSPPAGSEVLDKTKELAQKSLDLATSATVSTLKTSGKAAYYLTAPKFVTRSEIHGTWRLDQSIGSTVCAANIELTPRGDVIARYEGEENVNGYLFQSRKWPRSCTIEFQSEAFQGPSDERPMRYYYRGSFRRKMADKNVIKIVGKIYEVKQGRFGRGGGPGVEVGTFVARRRISRRDRDRDWEGGSNEEDRHDEGGDEYDDDYDEYDDDYDRDDYYDDDYDENHYK